MRNGSLANMSENLESSDFNNNPSGTNYEPTPDTKVKNSEPDQNSARVTLNFSESHTPEQSRITEKPNRYSLPADFTPGSHLRNHNCNTPSEMITNSQGKKL